MIKNLKLNNYIILFIPLGFILGPLILELLLIFLTILFFIDVKKNDFFKYINNFFFKIFFIFSIYLILSFFLFSRYDLGYTYSLFFIRYGLYFLALFYFISKNKTLRNFFLISFLILNSFVVLDALIQYFFGTNILGYEIKNSTRLSGIFDDEYILGSYLVKTSIFLFAIIFVLEKNFYIKNLAILSIMISFIVIILSGERSALFLFLIYCAFLFIFLDIKLSKKLFFSLIIILITSIIMLNNQNVIKRLIHHTIFDLIGSNNLTQNFYDPRALILKDHIYKDCINKKEFKNKDCSNNKIYFFSATHQNYFITSLNIFKHNIFFGSGPKTFRILCKDKKYNLNRWSCSSHPHNYYFQLMAETGLIGVSILIIAYFSIIIKILRIKFNKYLSSNSKNYYLVFLGGLGINYFPLVPTGNFFSNWLIIISLLPVIFILDYKNEIS